MTIFQLQHLGFFNFFSVHLMTWNWDGGVRMVTGLQTGRSEVRIPTVARDFSFTRQSKLALAITHPPIQWTPQVLPGGKAAGV